MYRLNIDLTVTILSIVVCMCNTFHIGHSWTIYEYKKITTFRTTHTCTVFLPVRSLFSVSLVGGQDGKPHLDTSSVCFSIDVPVGVSERMHILHRMNPLRCAMVPRLDK